MNEKLRIFACSSNPALAEEMCACLGISLSKLTITRFSNDNLFVQVLENVRERDVFVVQSCTQPVSDNLMELMITMDALRSASARRITAVIPYYSYARSDKKDAPRISITGRLIADLLQTAGANRVLTMDLHAPQVHGFFSVPVDHLTAVPLMTDYIGQSYDLSNTAVVAADAGGAKRVGRVAARLKLPMAIIDKRRVGDQNVHQGFVVGEVKGKNAIVFEDEIATGSTMVTTIHTLRDAGVETIIAGATHPILVGDAVQNLSSSPLQELIVTNTCAVGPEKRFDKLTVLSVAPLLAEAVRRIHTGESVGALFT
ncbi:MAG: ribose-phosphate pyrophosphokinase [Caldilineaceae bacterium]|nr:ribose-phosphate pyrophosphokinase [Caldilineaceae bacterium]